MSKSLEEVNQSVPTQNKTTVFRKILAFFGPAYLVSVGYMAAVSLAMLYYGFY
jgi:manganese transport protein